jgi:hypothetical protein
VAVRVEYLDEEPGGLTSMLGGLIEGNLAEHPEREALLKRALVGIIADDAGVSVSLRFAPGSVTVWNGLSGGRHDLLIRTTSEDLIGLSSVPLRFGLPDAMTKDGRAVTRKLLDGRLKVKGMFRHLATLTRLQRLLSVV